jgi:hypothetical protein
MSSPDIERDFALDGERDMALTRRSLFAAAGAAVGITVIPALITPETDLPGTVPFGVQIHSLFRDSVYGSDEAVLSCVQDSGAVYARDLLGLGSFDQAALFRRYRDAGIMLHLTIGAYGSTTTADRVEYGDRLSAVGDCVDSVAGWNEPGGNGVPRTEWLPATIEHQRWLHLMVKSDPALAHITVLPGALRDQNPSLGADLAALYSGIAGFYDVANLHLYPGPTRDPRTYLNDRLTMVPGSRAWITEGGASTYRITEARQAYICTELVKAQAERGDRTYIYELLDDPGPAESESMFGVYRSDYTRKPAAAALAGL